MTLCSGGSMDLMKVMREAVAPRPVVARPIVLVGAGGIAHDAHLPAYKKAGFPVVAVVDKNRQKAEALAKQFEIPFVAGTIAEAIAYAPKDAVFDCAVPAPALIERSAGVAGWCGSAAPEANGRDIGRGGGDFADLPEQRADGGGEFSTALGSEYAGGAGADGTGYWARCTTWKFR